jgi:hypothetical protein
MVATLIRWTESKVTPAMPAQSNITARLPYIIME